MSKITPFLWFDTEAEDAAHFYVSVFKNAKLKNVVRMGDGRPGEKGHVTLASFELNGLSFTAMNGGPSRRINEAVSFYVDCKDQAEVDHYWDKLGAGGKVLQCGWLTDKFGVTWQIIPEALPRLLSGPDRAAAGRVMQAMMQMIKIEVAKLEQAYRG
jgi:predicted 3-demethylubiquinone-9 3-methyltransferase (glyoxalase superfamily)